MEINILPNCLTKLSYGSIGMLNVCQVVTAIHLYIRLNKPGFDVFTDNNLLATIKEEFNRK